MNITAKGYSLRVEWPRQPRNIHQEILRRLKSINGAEWDAEARCWWVPLAQGDKLMALFPRASYCVDAIWACTDAAARRATVFYDSLIRMGIDVRIDDSGAVVAFGEGVSPLLQQLVDERAAALRPLVLQRGERAKPTAVVPPATPLAAQPKRFQKRGRK